MLTSALLRASMTVPSAARSRYRTCAKGTRVAIASKFGDSLPAYFRLNSCGSNFGVVTEYDTQLREHEWLATSVSRWQPVR